MMRVLSERHYCFLGEFVEALPIGLMLELPQVGKVNPQTPGAVLHSALTPCAAARTDVGLGSRRHFVTHRLIE